MYDKKRQLLEKKRRNIKGERTRMEIVYAPKEKMPFEAMVQFPPKVSNLYLCAIINDMTKCKPKAVVSVEGGYVLFQHSTVVNQTSIQLDDSIKVNTSADESISGVYRGIFKGKDSGRNINFLAISKNNKVILIEIVDDIKVEKK